MVYGGLTAEDSNMYSSQPSTCNREDKYLACLFLITMASDDELFQIVIAKEIEMNGNYKYIVFII